MTDVIFGALVTGRRYGKLMFNDIFCVLKELSLAVRNDNLVLTSHS